MSQEQENHNLKEKSQSTDANTEMDEMVLEFSEEGFIAAIVALLATVTDDSRQHPTPMSSQVFVSTDVGQQRQVTAGDLGN